MKIYQDTPCNGCTLCCQNDMVRILPDEDAGKWNTVQHPLFGGNTKMLAHKANGDCYYLNENNCSIQHDKPRICREMDCRNIAQAFTYTQARKIKGLKIEVWKRGKELIAEKS